MKGEGWDSRDDSPYWGCLLGVAIGSLIWLIVLIALGVF